MSMSQPALPFAHGTGTWESFHRLWTRSPSVPEIDRKKPAKSAFIRVSRRAARPSDRPSCRMMSWAGRAASPAGWAAKHPPARPLDAQTALLGRMSSAMTRFGFGTCERIASSASRLSMTVNLLKALFSVRIVASSPRAAMSER